MFENNNRSLVELIDCQSIHDKLSWDNEQNKTKTVTI